MNVYLRNTFRVKAWTRKLKMKTGHTVTSPRTWAGYPAKFKSKPGLLKG